MARTWILPLALVGPLGCSYPWDVLPQAGGGGGGGSGGGPATSTASTATGCEACPVPLAEGQPFPRALRVDAGFVYWANLEAAPDTPSVLRVPSEGGPVETLASDVRSPLSIALDATHVYATEYELDGRLVRVPRGGGATETVVQGAAPLTGVAVDASGVYFADASGDLFKWSLPGGPLTTLGNAGIHPTVLAIADGHVYGGSFDAGTGIWRIPLGGGTTETVSPEVGAAPGVAASATQIAYTVIDLARPESGAVRVMGFDGGDLLTIATGQGQPAEIALHSGQAFWANAYTGTVVRGGVSAGTPVVLASGQTSPNGVAVDGANVYWTNHAPDGSVMKLPLP